jgi:hypothetical protein
VSESTDAVLFGGVLVVFAVWLSVSGTGRAALFAFGGLAVSLLGLAHSLFGDITPEE